MKIIAEGYYLNLIQCVIQYFAKCMSSVMGFAIILFIIYVLS